MIDCKNCNNAIFDPVFGEYKCRISERVNQNTILVACSHYEAGTPETSKETPDGYGEDE